MLRLLTLLVLVFTTSAGVHAADSFIWRKGLVLVKGQLGRTSSDSGWNSACDVDGNGRVDAADLAQVTRNQGR